MIAKEAEKAYSLQTAGPADLSALVLEAVIESNELVDKSIGTDLTPETSWEPQTFDRRVEEDMEPELIVVGLVDDQVGADGLNADEHLNEKLAEAADVGLELQAESWKSWTLKWMRVVMELIAVAVIALLLLEIGF